MSINARARIPICGLSSSSPALALFLACMCVSLMLVGCARQVTGGAASQQQIPSPPAAPSQPPAQPAATPTPAAPTQGPQVEAAPSPPPPAVMEASRPEAMPPPPTTAPALEERVVEVPPPSPPPMAPLAEPSAPPPAVVPAPTAAVIPTQALSDVYFDYDQSALRADAQTALAANAQHLQSGSSKSVVIEGHCDERGTHAYNLVLGERRAQAVKRYLEDLGVPSERIRIVSYGKERPFCSDHSEACWQENRRAHFSPR